MYSELEKRVIDLEVLCAHQNETIETLNDVVTSQGKVIDRLTKALSQIQEQMLDLEDMVDQLPPSQKPPHY